MSSPSLWSDVTKTSIWPIVLFLALLAVIVCEMGLVSWLAIHAELNGEKLAVKTKTLKKYLISNKQNAISEIDREEIEQLRIRMEELEIHWIYPDQMTLLLHLISRGMPGDIRVVELTSTASGHWFEIAIEGESDALHEWIKSLEKSSYFTDIRFLQKKQHENSDKMFYKIRIKVFE